MSAAQPGDPRLVYTGQDKAAVKADYADMPSGAQIVLVNTTSGTAVGSGTLLDSTGAGSVSVPIGASTPSGKYVLAANDATGNEIAQTVAFYISDDDGGSL